MTIFYFSKHPPLIIPTPLIIAIWNHFRPPDYSHPPPVYSVLESMARMLTAKQVCFIFFAQDEMSTVCLKVSCKCQTEIVNVFSSLLCM